MAMPFGANKKPIHWLKKKGTQEFIDNLSEVLKSTSADLLTVIKGGNDKMSQGTWMHRDLAMEYARWVEPCIHDLVYLPIDMRSQADPST